MLIQYSTLTLYTALYTSLSAHVGLPETSSAKDDDEIS